MSVLGIATGRSATWRPQIDYSAVTALVGADTPAAVVNTLTSQGVAASTDTTPQQKAVALTGVAIGAVVRWIPTEIVVLYGAVVAASQPADPRAAPVVPVAPWIVCLFASPILSLILAIATKNKDNIVWKTILAPVAFVLWSETIPNSAWNLLPWFSPSGPTTLLVLGLTAALFTPVAELLAPQDATT